MSNLFNNESPKILPKKAFNRTSFLEIISPIVKMDIIQEGEGKIARNSSKLDLTNSIYEKIDEE